VRSFFDQARHEEAADARAQQHAADHRSRRIEGIPEIEEEPLDQDDLHEHVADAESAEVQEGTEAGSPAGTEEAQGQQDQDDGSDSDLEDGHQDQQVPRFEEGEGTAVQPEELRDAPPAEKLGEVGAVVGGGQDVEGVIGDEAPRDGLRRASR